ncbi:MAG: PEP-CTERM/exosortase system-associated acyltransferase [Syntrophaceae bacterium]|nr:PEP-CTERM/exosortase system-associated acyltransferase [Syntrophaceae bacterium]
MEFKFKKVDSEELLKEIFRVRYEVYCEECGYLPTSDYPDGLEIDEFDENSIHFAAFADDRVIGTSRLVMNSKNGFPMNEHCHQIDIDNSTLATDSVVEVSRLALRKSFRRRKEDGIYAVESYLTKSQGGILAENPEERTEQDRKRQQPVVILGLYKAMYHETRRINFSHWLAAMEKKLWYALKTFHFTFQEIGPQVDYYGPVTPYLGFIEKLEKEVNDNSPELWSFLLDGLDEKYWPEFMRSAAQKR